MRQPLYCWFRASIIFITSANFNICPLSVLLPFWIKFDIYEFLANIQAALWGEKKNHDLPTTSNWMIVRAWQEFLLLFFNNAYLCASFTFHHKQKRIDAKNVLWWWVNWKEPRWKSNYCSAWMYACVWLERKTFNSAFSLTMDSAGLYREPTDNQ